MRMLILEVAFGVPLLYPPCNFRGDALAEIVSVATPAEPRGEKRTFLGC